MIEKITFAYEKNTTQPKEENDISYYLGTYFYKDKRIKIPFSCLKCEIDEKDIDELKEELIKNDVKLCNDYRESRSIGELLEKAGLSDDADKNVVAYILQVYKEASERMSEMLTPKEYEELYDDVFIPRFEEEQEY